MAVKTYVKPILPKMYPQHEQVIRRNIRNATKRVCDHGAEELRFLVETWQHQPDPRVTIQESASEIKGSVIVEDLAMFMLDGGTRIKWVKLSEDFMPKTKVRSLRSGPGRGRVELRGKKALIEAGELPRPGIDAREFSETLLQLLTPEFNAAINQVMSDAVNRGQARP